MYIYIYIYIYSWQDALDIAATAAAVGLAAVIAVGCRVNIIVNVMKVGYHKFISQNDKSRVSNPISKYMHRIGPIIIIIR